MQSRFTLRIPREMLQKISYIANENGRSANREIEILLKKYIVEYEEQYGTIKIDQE